MRHRRQDAWPPQSAAPPCMVWTPGRAMRHDRPAVCRAERTVLVRIAGFYCACSLPFRKTKVVPVLVLIIIVIAYWASLVGGGRAVLMVVVTAVATAAA